MSKMKWGEKGNRLWNKSQDCNPSSSCFLRSFFPDCFWEHIMELWMYSCVTPSSLVHQKESAFPWKWLSVKTKSDRFRQEIYFSKSRHSYQGKNTRGRDRKWDTRKPEEQDKEKRGRYQTMKKNAETYIFFTQKKNCKKRGKNHTQFILLPWLRFLLWNLLLIREGRKSALILN